MASHVPTFKFCLEVPGLLHSTNRFVVTVTIDKMSEGDTGDASGVTKAQASDSVGEALKIPARASTKPGSGDTSKEYRVSK